MKDQGTRFHIITDRTELIQPYCSQFNRSQDEEWYIDTDVDGDDGRIYIGKTDFEQLARLVGWGPPATQNEKSELANLQKENSDLRTLLASLRSIASDLLDRTNFSEEPQSNLGPVITAGGIVNGPSSIQPARRIKPSPSKDSDGTEISI